MQIILVQLSLALVYVYSMSVNFRKEIVTLKGSIRKVSQEVKGIFKNRGSLCFQISNVSASVTPTLINIGLLLLERRLLISGFVIKGV